MKNGDFIFLIYYSKINVCEKLTYFLLFFITSYSSIFAQESPYYQLPQNRKGNHELVTMPNLHTFSITYFMAASVGLKKTYNGASLPSPSPIESNSDLTEFWDFTIGQTRNDNWIYEIGIANYKSNLSTSFLALTRNPLPFRNETNQYYLPLKVKKRILTLDKVSRSAFLYVGIGGSYLVKNKTKTNEQGRIIFNQRSNPEPRDYTTLDFEISSSERPFAIEILTEIRGKVSNRLEISAFGRALMRTDRPLNNQFTFNYVDQSTASFVVYEKPFSILFGIQAKFNSPQYHRYKSNVE